MGRKKKPTQDEPAAQKEESSSSKKRRPADSSDDDDDYEEVERRHYDIDPDIQELAYTFNIDAGLTQKLNDIMIEQRQRTWEQDLERLYEILKDAHTPAAMLNLKVRDMEKGTFVGKAKCGPRVREMAKRHRLDKGAATKLEEAMSMREAMGKDVDKDLTLLDEHLSASNKPSALVSMKLESLRKGFNIGHCIYSREPMPGNQGPGVDGVFDKKTKRTLGYTDADLDKRFAEQEMSSGSGQLMDEATVRRMMAAERKRHEAKLQEEEAPAPSQGKKAKRKRSRSGSSRPKRKQEAKRSRSASRRKARSRSASRRKARSRSASRKKGRSRSASRGKRKSRSRSASRKGSRSRRTSGSRSPSGRSRGVKGKHSKKSPTRSRSRRRHRSRSGKK